MGRRDSYFHSQGNWEPRIQHILITIILCNERIRDTLEYNMVGGVIRVCIKDRKLDKEQMMEHTVLSMHEVLHAAMFVDKIL